MILKLEHLQKQIRIEPLLESLVKIFSMAKEVMVMVVSTTPRDFGNELFQIFKSIGISLQAIVFWTLVVQRAL